jgi:AcrR family transcriptional regulator
LSVQEYSPSGNFVSIMAPEYEHNAHITDREANLTTRIASASSLMRKEPRQARARATTEAILDAAAHILGERGWKGLTTNAVAEAAGVSIGSLYQYFPNKLALIEAVRRRHFDEVLAIFRTAADARIPRARRIAAFVDGMITVHSRYPAAHRVLLEEAPRGKDSSGMHSSFETEYQRGCEALFRANVRRMSAAKPHIAAQVLAAAVSGAVHQAAHQGNLLSSDLRHELIALVESYLSSR